MSNNNQNRTQTSTQIRNFYSEGISYMNISFYNTSLSFRFYPFLSRDNNGISKYDLQNGQQTTVNYEGAYALYKMSKDILEGKVTECDLPIPCLGATVILKREVGPDGKYQTIFSITKNNMTIPFKFQVIESTTRVNGQVVTTIIEAGLGAFQKTIEGYLNGINADRHLNKLTDEFVSLQQQGQNSNNNQQNGNNNGYNKYSNNNGGYKKSYNGNNNGYKKYNNGGNGNYNNNSNQQNNWGGNKQPNQQNMSSYNIPN